MFTLKRACSKHLPRRIQIFNYSKKFNFENLEKLDLNKLTDLSENLEKLLLDFPKYEIDEDLEFTDEEIQQISAEFENESKVKTQEISEEDEEEEDENQKENEIMRNLQLKIQQEFQQKRKLENEMLEKFDKKLHGKKNEKEIENEEAKRFQRLAIKPEDLKLKKSKTEVDETSGQKLHSNKIRKALEFVLANKNKDEKLKTIEIREVYLNKDFKTAKVKYEILNKKDEKIIKNTLRKVSGFLSSQVSSSLNIHQ
jgi:hypothetical protein